MAHIIVGCFMGFGIVVLFVGLIDISKDKTDYYGLYKKLSEQRKVLIAETENGLMSFLKIICLLIMAITTFYIAFGEYEYNFQYIPIAIAIYLGAGVSCAVVNGSISKVLLFDEDGVWLCGVSNGLIGYNDLKYLVISKSKNPDLEQWGRVNVSFEYEGRKYVSQLAIYDFDDDCLSEEDILITQNEADNNLIYDWTKQYLKNETD